jgi:hypothetical protein
VEGGEDRDQGGDGKADERGRQSGIQLVGIGAERQGGEHPRDRAGDQGRRAKGEDPPLRPASCRHLGHGG